jgi:Uma2 family endonuclease
MAGEAVQVRRWTRDEYHRLGEQGFFAPDERVELLDGEIYTVSPQGTRHASVVVKVGYALGGVFRPPGFHVRPQVPIAPDEKSEPEPDASVVPGTPDDYMTDHPRVLLLIVEVADSSLSHDRHIKGPIYARAGVLDYWVVNLVDDLVEVYRDPTPDPHSRTGWSYRSTQVVAKGQTIEPLASPGRSILASDLLP